MTKKTEWKAYFRKASEVNIRKENLKFRIPGRRPDHQRIEENAETFNRQKGIE
jgi:hypothetical protein